MQKLPKINILDLLEAGVHFGHKTNRWNPKMLNYIYGEKDGIHIINLEKTIPMLERALKACYEVAAEGGRILFVGTKHQATEYIEEFAKKCGQYYVNYRWLGGMLTNWVTVSKSIKTLNDLEDTLAGDLSGFTKKEILSLNRKQEKLQKALGGIRSMGNIPDLLFIIDIKNDDIALSEAIKLGIPVVAICDTNVDPTLVEFPIPGNDDSSKAIALYCNLISSAILDGMQTALSGTGYDIGELENPDIANVTPDELNKIREIVSENNENSNEENDNDSNN